MGPLEMMLVVWAVVALGIFVHYRWF